MAQISKKLKYNEPIPKNIKNSGVVRSQNYNDAVEDISNIYNIINNMGGGLSGANFAVVTASGTPTENGAELLAAYDVAKAVAGLTTENRYTIVMAPGTYNTGTALLVDTEFIDFVSLTGNRDVIFDLGVDPYPTAAGPVPYINVTANDVYLKGFDSVAKNATYWGSGTKYHFKVATNLNLLTVENCEGGPYSFGGDFTLVTPLIISGTYINCRGGYQAFAGASTASGTFIDCTAYDGQNFGNWGTASGFFQNCSIGGFNERGFGSNGIASGTFIDCIASGRFASSATVSGYILRCKGLFLCESATITGTVLYSISEQSPISTVSGSGITMYCIGANAPDNQGFVATNKL